MAITRPTTKTIISTVGWGIPITDEVNRLTTDLASTKPTAWTNMVLQNGWGPDQAMQVAQYRKIGDVVELRGSITGGANGSVVTTMPDGFRVARAMRIFAGSYNGTTTVTCRADLQVTGTIQFYDIGLTFLILTGIRYSIL